MVTEIRTVIAYLGVRYDWNKATPASFDFFLSGYRLHLLILYVYVCVYNQISLNCTLRIMLISLYVNLTSVIKKSSKLIIGEKI